MLINNRLFLSEELPLNMHVRHVEYIENGSKHMTGSLYMTTFRLIFAPEIVTDENDSVNSIIPP